jgi:hypothetical protein
LQHDPHDLLYNLLCLVVIVKILSHLRLPTRAAPHAPARRVDLFQTI